MHFGIFMEFETRDGRSQKGSFEDGFALVDAAEAWGLDGVWLGEMHFNPARSVLSAPIVVATAIATRTQRLRVGSSAMGAIQPGACSVSRAGASTASFPDSRASPATRTTCWVWGSVG